MQLILFNCRFTPTSLFEGGSHSLRGKEVLEDIIDKDFRHRETFHFARPDNDKVYFHEYVDSGHEGVYVFRIANHHVVINNNVLSRRRWRTESPYLYVIMDFTEEQPVIMIQKYDAVPTSKKEVILVLSENFNQLLFLYGLQMELKPSKTKTSLSRMLEQEMDAYNDLAPTIEELHGVDNIFKLLPQEIYQMNMNDINKNIENMMNDFKGLFDGANISNSQINVVTGNDNHISYEAPKREEKQEPVQGQKQSVMDYVGRLMPVVAEEYRDYFTKIWLEILEQNAVSQVVYDKGNQKGTIFNRNLVAQISHMMAMGGIILQNTSVVRMTELLEPEKGKNHPVRGALAISPEDKQVKKAVNDVLEKYGVKAL